MKLYKSKYLLIVLAAGLFLMLSSCENEILTEPEVTDVSDTKFHSLKSKLDPGTNAEKYDVTDELSLLTNANPQFNKRPKIKFREGFDGLNFQKAGGQQVEIPDANFEQALIDLGVDDVLDGFVLKNNVKNVTELNVEEKNISDLTGIEHFSELKVLNCNFNLLTSLDIRKNRELTELYCFVNQITGMDVSRNTELKILFCSGNPLMTLDVTKNESLEELWASSNELSSLDVTKNEVLRLLTCRAQYLTSLDLSNNKKLETLLAGPNNLLESLDLSNNPALEIILANFNQLSSINLGDKPNLLEMNLRSNQLTSIDVSQCNVMESLILWENQLSSIDLSNNTALVYLDLDTNQLTGLDVSNLSLLENLFIPFNQMSYIDVSQNTNLVLLDGTANPILSYDFANNSNLSLFSCAFNQLTSLDISPCSSDMSLFWNFGNPFLTCIKVTQEQLDNSIANNYFWNAPPTDPIYTTGSCE